MKFTRCIPIVVMLFTTCIFSISAQQFTIPADRKVPSPLETSGDPYLPNAHGNKKVTPAYHYTSNSAMRTNGSTITTVQVNIDSSGQNIVDDAGNEPNIAIDPLQPNKIVIGWRQFDNIASNFRQAGWSFTTDGGQTWTFPGRIEQGIFRSDPVLDFDDNGNFYYNSLTLDSANNYSCDVFKSADGGMNWGNKVPAAGGDKQWMAIDRTTGVGNGNIYSEWTYFYSSCTPGYFTRSTDGGNSYESCTEIEGVPRLGTSVIGNSGELYVCGSDTITGIDLVVCKSLNAQIPGALVTWQQPTIAYMDGYIGGSLINPAGLLGQANIDVDPMNGVGQDNVYVLAAMVRISNGDPGDIMFAKSSDGGVSFDFPIKINDDNSIFNTQWLGTMSVAPNGRIDAVWLDNRDANGYDSSALYYSYSNNQGATWSVNERLSGLFDPHVGYPNQDKMGDYFDMISDNNGAHLAWAATFNGEEDVYYSYIRPQIPTGIYENNKVYSIYPNPTTGKIAIKGCTINSKVEVFTSVGQQIYSSKVSDVNFDVNLSEQSAGIYFVKITDGSGNSRMMKVVKE